MSVQWINVLLIIGLSLSGSFVAYGILKGKTETELTSLRRDIDALQTNLAMFVTRTEYESRHKDIQQDLNRIEGKIDRLMEMRFAGHLT